MAVTRDVGAVQLGIRLHGVSPPVTRRLVIAEQTTLGQLHGALQVAFGWSNDHFYTFQIRGWQFGDRARAWELASGGGVDIPLAAFGFQIGEPFRYQYNLLVPWEIDCRVESRCLISADQPVTCLAAQGDPPNEDLAGPEAYPVWLEESSPSWAVHQIEALVDEDLDDDQFRAEAQEILSKARLGRPTRRAIDERLRQLPQCAWDAGSIYENKGPADYRGCIRRGDDGGDRRD